jgi:acyl-CoA synthetase (AMP-forming)/AMP-acid ligase II
MAADPLSSRARRTPDALALVDRGGGLRLTWGQLDAMAGAWANRLEAAGVMRGERVAVVEPAGARFAALLHACIRIGAVIVPLPPRAKDSEKARLIDQSRPRAVIDRGEVDLRHAGVRAEGDL